MTRSGKIMFVSGIAALLSYAAIPLSSYANSTYIDRAQIKIRFGVSELVGLSVISNEVGVDSGVEYDNETHAYTKTMEGGERVPEFGITTMRIYCNTSSDNTTDKNCLNNGFSLTAAPGDTVKVGTETYAALMSESEGYHILSSSDSLDTADSAWVMSVSVGQGLPYEILDENDQNITVSGRDERIPLPEVATAYREGPHRVPNAPEEIVYGNTFQDVSVSGDKEPHYIYVSDYTATVTYGIGVSGGQASGTYSGSITYTVAPRVNGTVRANS